jgi:methionine sulfoxide reductase heme-binding subunit
MHARPAAEWRRFLPSRELLVTDTSLATSPPVRDPRPLWLFAAVPGCVLVIAALALLAAATTAEALLYVTRYTARFSFLIFAVVFATRALFELAPSPATRWLRRNRRYLGLSFALAHFLHLAALSAYFTVIGERPGVVTLVGGGIAYAFVAFMAATSNDRSVRALGRTTWQRIHFAGSVYIWLIFMNSYVGRLLGPEPPEPRVIFSLTAAIGFAAAALRVIAWWRRRRA